MFSHLEQEQEQEQGGKKEQEKNQLQKDQKKAKCRLYHLYELAVLLLLEQGVEAVHGDPVVLLDLGQADPGGG